MCSSSERNVNYATQMVCMLLSSKCEEQQSVDLVQFLWAKGHIPSEIHKEMCGVYGKTMDHSNVSRWCSFFKAAIP